MTATYGSLLAGTTSPGLFVWRGRDDRDLVREAEDAGWRAVRLDSRGIDSVDDFWDAVVTAWSLPSWFGRNLDALFDVLGDRTDAPTVLVWSGLTRLADLDPERAEAVVEVLRDVVGQAPAFAVVVRDAPDVSGFDGLL